MNETRIDFEIQPVMPTALARLPALADDLSYTWDRRIQELFGQTPRIFRNT